MRVNIWIVLRRLPLRHALSSIFAGGVGIARWTAGSKHSEGCDRIAPALGAITTMDQANAKPLQPLALLS